MSTERDFYVVFSELVYGPYKVDEKHPRDALMEAFETIKQEFLDRADVYDEEEFEKFEKGEMAVPSYV